MEDPASVVSARGLGHVWPGGGRALADVSLAVAAGEKVALVGPNGAGKSTLLRLLAGRLKPREGELAVAGRAAYLPQDVELDPEMTAGETLTLIGALLGLPVSRMAAAAATFGLEPHLRKPVAELSGGWRRRLDLALLLLEDKDLLLLDEPASGLDAAGEEILFAELEERAARGVAILVAGHDLGRLARFTRRALCFAGGRLVGEGAPEDFAAVAAEGLSGPAPGSRRGRGQGRRG